MNKATIRQSAPKNPVIKKSERMIMDAKGAFEALGKLGINTEIKANGIANNFVSFIPRKNHIIFELKIEQTTEIDQLMIDQDIDSLPYDRKWSQYRLKISPGQEKNFDVVLSLVRKAYDYYYH